MWSPDISALAGGAQTGLTSPTFDLTLDTPPNAGSGKQYAVTALGGTQAGVDVHTTSNPFTVTFERPKVLRTAGVANPSSGVLGSVPRNVFTLRVRKGVVPLSGQSPQVAMLECKFNVPAGADAADPESVRSALSLLVGILNDTSSGIGDSLVNGVL